MNNPFQDAEKTSLSEMPEHEWLSLYRRWDRSRDSFIKKVRVNNWVVNGRLGQGMPHFKTKSEAYIRALTLIQSEIRWRDRQRWEQQHTKGEANE